MTTKTTAKAVLVSDKAMTELLKRKVGYYREGKCAVRAERHIPGTASYALFGVNPRQELVVLADAPTASDFNQHVTAKNKAALLACNFDYLIEYRDSGSHSKPKVLILCWTRSE